MALALEHLNTGNASIVEDVVYLENSCQGMVFTLEPRLTVPGYGVATIEEMVLITAHRAEYL